jgi:TonB family protein
MRVCALALLLILDTVLIIAQSPAPQTDANQTIYEVGVNGVQPPHAINNVTANFPPEARQKKINGRCAVSLRVDVEGKPQDIKLVRCSDPVFAQTTLDTAARYLFKPATTPDGKQVSTRISIEINFQRDDVQPLAIPVRYGFRSPPDMTSPAPDADGVYPLVSPIVPPLMDRFSDEGYGDAAFILQGGGACDLLLTIDAKGRPSHIQVMHCEKPSLEKLAAQSLLKSHYKPGTINGKTVPVKASLHLELGSFSSTN